jgi:phosphoribosyl 1,2-cyclic phosphate phosphodiesterase
MKLTFLGTGTSHGIPAIGCDCAVCTSTDRRNWRRRSSVYIVADGFHLVIDTPPDFREQVLTFGVRRVDALLLTHAHADHIFGFDDVRRFCFLQDMVIPVYGSPATLADMRQKFSYVINDSFWKATAPQVAFHEVSEPWPLGPFTVEPVSAPHGPMQVYGYVIRHGQTAIGYFPDCSAVDDALALRLQNLDVMILDALREKEHPTHLCLSQSIDALQRINARTSYITHLCHDLEHTATQARLSANQFVAYDGLAWSSNDA